MYRIIYKLVYNSKNHLAQYASKGWRYAQDETGEFIYKSNWNYTFYKKKLGLSKDPSKAMVLLEKNNV